MKALLSQCWLENIDKAARSAYLTCPTYSEYNPEKAVHTSQMFKIA